MQQDEWIYKASLFELLATSLLYPSQELAQALISGEYSEAVLEIAELNGLALPAGALDEGVRVYEGRTADEVFHELRREYTRLFIGAKSPLVTPYGGSWYALERGMEPLLFVGKESMAVERFLRKCGAGQPENTNEPLDHIASELEFLQYLCLLKAQVLVAPEGVEIQDTDYAEFYTTHFSWFAQLFAVATQEHCKAPFFNAVAQLLQALPPNAL